MRHRQRLALTALLSSCALVAACQAKPGPAPTVQSGSQAAVEQQVESLAVVVSAFSSGFNPHLVSNATPLVRHIASLVLPSPFIEGASTSTSSLVQNTDLVSDVTLLNAEQAASALRSSTGSSSQTTTESSEDSAAGDTTSGNADAGHSGSGDSGSADSDSGDSASGGSDAETSTSGDTTSDINSDTSSDAAPTSSSDTPAFAVRYTLNANAQWSDGTPITGSDFEYLWKQMTTQPGAADPAGYEAISTITTGESGRVVTVFFAQPYAEWKTLFQYLLPSHLYRSTSSFETVMNTAVAVSGNRYTVTSVDLGLGTITLSRNDRYWGETTAQSDRIVLQTSTNPSSDAELLRSGNAVAVSVRPVATTQLALSTTPDTTVQVIPQNRYLMMNLNLASVAVQDAGLRTRVLAAINRDEVAKIASGRLDATAPSDSSTVAGTTIPAAAVNPEPTAATTGASAGSATSSSDGSSAGSDTTSQAEPSSPTTTAPNAAETAARAASRVGTTARPFRIVVAESDAQALAAARTIGDQLARAGMTAVVRTASAAEIATSVLPFGLADAVVQWSTGDSTADLTASHYRCETTQRQASDPSDSLRSKMMARASTSIQSSSASTSASGADSADGAAGTDGAASGSNAASADGADGSATSNGSAGGDSASSSGSDSTQDSGDASGDHTQTNAEDTSTSDSTDSTDAITTDRTARASNISGVCDTQIDGVLTQWLKGSTQVTDSSQSGGITALTQVQADEYRAAVLGRVNSLGITVALLQDVEVAASTSNLSVRRVDGQLPATEDGGIFVSAFEWRTATSPTSSETPAGE